jgi:hypothetical protein
MSISNTRKGQQELLAINNSRKNACRQGFCNICQTFGGLTNDHVPPQGSMPPRKVGLKSLPGFVECGSTRIERLVSQNGIKFRTLCNRCNNARLGKRYDPALNELSKRMAGIVRSRQVSLPPRVTVTMKPQRVARSVVGHLLAAELKDDAAAHPGQSAQRDLMRTYFLDESVDLPDAFNLYLWPFIANYQVILNKIAVLVDGQVVRGDFLKYFPAAFWLTYEAPDSIKNSMSDHEVSVRGRALDEEGVICIDMGENGISSTWPEFPGDNEIVCIGERNCIVAVPAN